MLEHRNYSRGISIIELLVVIMIIGVAISASISFSTFSLRTASLFKQTTQASFFAKEYVEALKNYRDNTGWTDDDPGNNYDGLGQVTTGVSLHLELSGDTPPRWQLLLGQETLGIFTREVVVDLVERDAADNIVESGGTLDPQTKKVTVTVFWEERQRTHDIQVTTYLTNWR
ncbi:prepilin-type N-terminal cleavage/methylation domain-containing protein [Patescibacteria group bacterium]|nr:prepilin-type N-terminal cleavage/methylation domain-containing protein [Patescibacteria group bacterium]